MRKKIRIASLFTGCGGMDLGMVGGFTFLGKYYAKNPIELVFANDVDNNACAIFNENFNHTITQSDIKNIPSSKISDHDVLIAGFPCQPFSIIAQNPPRIGLDSPLGNLFTEVIRVLKDKQPACFIAENVKGIISSNAGKAFPLILKQFEKSGYMVSWKLVNSVNFGVPQNRERIFIVGFRKDLNITPVIEEPQLAMVPLRKTLNKSKHVSLKYYFSERAILGLERSRREQPNMNKGRVQNTNKPCSTITAHLAKASLNSMDPVLKIGDKYRRITPKEAAKIQSFPDNFTLPSNTSDHRQYVAIGNAVPPVMMWYVSRQIMRQLVKKIRPSKHVRFRSKPRL